MSYESKLQEVYDAIIVKLKDMKEKGLEWDWELDDLLILYQAIEWESMADLIANNPEMLDE